MSTTQAKHIVGSVTAQIILETKQFTDGVNKIRREYDGLKRYLEQNPININMDNVVKNAKAAENALKNVELRYNTRQAAEAYNKSTEKTAKTLNDISKKAKDAAKSMNDFVDTTSKADDNLNKVKKTMDETKKNSDSAQQSFDDFTNVVKKNTDAVKENTKAKEDASKKTLTNSNNIKQIKDETAALKEELNILEQIKKENLSAKAATELLISKYGDMAKFLSSEIGLIQDRGKLLSGSLYGNEAGDKYYDKFASKTTYIISDMGEMLALGEKIKNLGPFLAEPILSLTKAKAVNHSDDYSGWNVGIGDVLLLPTQVGKAINILDKLRLTMDANTLSEAKLINETIQYICSLRDAEIAEKKLVETQKKDKIVKEQISDTTAQLTEEESGISRVIAENINLVTKASEAYDKLNSATHFYSGNIEEIRKHLFELNNLMPGFFTLSTREALKFMSTMNGLKNFELMSMEQFLKSEQGWLAKDLPINDYVIRFSYDDEGTIGGLQQKLDAIRSRIELTFEEARILKMELDLIGDTPNGIEWISHDIEILGEKITFVNDEFIHTNKGIHSLNASVESFGWSISLTNYELGKLYKYLSLIGGYSLKKGSLVGSSEDYILNTTKEGLNIVTDFIKNYASSASEEMDKLIAAQKLEISLLEKCYDDEIKIAKGIDTKTAAEMKYREAILKNIEEEIMYQHFLMEDETPRAFYDMVLMEQDKILKKLDAEARAEEKIREEIEAKIIAEKKHNQVLSEKKTLNTDSTNSKNLLNALYNEYLSSLRVNYKKAREEENKILMDSNVKFIERLKILESIHSEIVNSATKMFTIGDADSSKLLINELGITIDQFKELIRIINEYNGINITNKFKEVVNSFKLMDYNNLFNFDKYTQYIIPDEVIEKYNGFLDENSNKLNKVVKETEVLTESINKNNSAEQKSNELLSKNVELKRLEIQSNNDLIPLSKQLTGFYIDECGTLTSLTGIRLSDIDCRNIYVHGSDEFVNKVKNEQGSLRELGYTFEVLTEEALAFIMIMHEFENIVIGGNTNALSSGLVSDDTAWFISTDNLKTMKAIEEQYNKLTNLDKKYYEGFNARYDNAINYIYSLTEFNRSNPPLNYGFTLGNSTWNKDNELSYTANLKQFISDEDALFAFRQMQKRYELEQLQVNLIEKERDLYIDIGNQMDRIAGGSLQVLTKAYNEFVTAKNSYVKSITDKYDYGSTAAVDAKYRAMSEYNEFAIGEKYIAEYADKCRMAKKDFVELLVAIEGADGVITDSIEGMFNQAQRLDLTDAEIKQMIVDFNELNSSINGTNYTVVQSSSVNSENTKVIKEETKSVEELYQELIKFNNVWASIFNRITAFPALAEKSVVPLKDMFKEVNTVIRDYGENLKSGSAWYRGFVSFDGYVSGKAVQFDLFRGMEEYNRKMVEETSELVALEGELEGLYRNQEGKLSSLNGLTLDLISKTAYYGSILRLSEDVVPSFVGDIDYSEGYNLLKLTVEQVSLLILRCAELKTTLMGFNKYEFEKLDGWVKYLQYIGGRYTGLINQEGLLVEKIIRNDAQLKLVGEELNRVYEERGLINLRNMNIDRTQIELFEELCNGATLYSNAVAEVNRKLGNLPYTLDLTEMEAYQLIGTLSELTAVILKLDKVTEDGQYIFEALYTSSNRYGMSNRVFDAIFNRKEVESTTAEIAAVGNVLTFDKAKKDLLEIANIITQINSKGVNENNIISGVIREQSLDTVKQLVKEIVKAEEAAAKLKEVNIGSIIKEQSLNTIKQLVREIVLVEEEIPIISFEINDIWASFEKVSTSARSFGEVITSGFNSVFESLGSSIGVIDNIVTALENLKVVIPTIVEEGLNGSRKLLQEGQKGGELVVSMARDMAVFTGDVRVGFNTLNTVLSDMTVLFDKLGISSRLFMDIIINKFPVIENLGSGAGVFVEKLISAFSEVSNKIDLVGESVSRTNSKIINGSEEVSNEIKLLGTTYGKTGDKIKSGMENQLNSIKSMLNTVEPEVIKLSKAFVDGVSVSGEKLRNVSKIAVDANNNFNTLFNGMIYGVENADVTFKKFGFDLMQTFTSAMTGFDSFNKQFNGWITTSNFWDNLEGKWKTVKANLDPTGLITFVNNLDVLINKTSNFVVKMGEDSVQIGNSTSYMGEAFGRFGTIIKDTIAVFTEYSENMNMFNGSGWLTAYVTNFERANAASQAFCEEQQVVAEVSRDTFNIMKETYAQGTTEIQMNTEALIEHRTAYESLLPTIVQIEYTNEAMKRSYEDLKYEEEQQLDILMQLRNGELSYMEALKASARAGSEEAMVMYEKEAVMASNIAWLNQMAINTQAYNNIEKEYINISKQHSIAAERQANASKEAAAANKELASSANQSKAALSSSSTGLNSVANSAGTATGALNRLKGALNSVKSLFRMFTTLYLWTFAFGLIEGVQETYQLKTEMESLQDAMGMTSSQVDRFNDALDNTVKKYQKINKFSLGETVASLGVEFNLTTAEMEKAMPVVSMVQSEFLRAGRRVNEATLAVKDVLQGEFTRLSRETGVGGDDLQEKYGWNGDKSDVVSMLNALERAGKDRNWDVFASKATSLNDVLEITKNRITEVGAEILSILTPAIVGVFNGISSLIGGIEGFITSLNPLQKLILLFSTLFATIKIGGTALAMYSMKLSILEVQQMGVDKALVATILKLEKYQVTEYGVVGAINAKIFGLNAEKAAQDKNITSEELAIIKENELAVSKLKLHQAIIAKVMGLEAEEVATYGVSGAINRKITAETLESISARKAELANMQVTTSIDERVLALARLNLEQQEANLTNMGWFKSLIAMKSGVDSTTIANYGWKNAVTASRLEGSLMGKVLTKLGVSYDASSLAAKSATKQNLLFGASMLTGTVLAYVAVIAALVVAYFAIIAPAMAAADAMARFNNLVEDSSAKIQEANETVEFYTNRQNALEAAISNTSLSTAELAEKTQELQSVQKNKEIAELNAQLTQQYTEMAASTKEWYENQKLDMQTQRLKNLSEALMEVGYSYEEATEKASTARLEWERGEVIYDQTAEHLRWLMEREEPDRIAEGVSKLKSKGVDDSQFVDDMQSAYRDIDEGYEKMMLSDNTWDKLDGWLQMKKGYLNANLTEMSADISGLWADMCNTWSTWSTDTPQFFKQLYDGLVDAAISTWGDFTGLWEMIFTPIHNLEAQFDKWWTDNVQKPFQNFINNFDLVEFICSLFEDTGASDDPSILNSILPMLNVTNIPILFYERVVLPIANEINKFLSDPIGYIGGLVQSTGNWIWDILCDWTNSPVNQLFMTYVITPIVNEINLFLADPIGYVAGAIQNTGNWILKMLGVSDEDIQNNSFGQNLYKLIVSGLTYVLLNAPSIAYQVGVAVATAIWNGLKSIPILGPILEFIAGVSGQSSNANSAGNNVGSGIHNGVISGMGHIANEVLQEFQSIVSNIKSKVDEAKEAAAAVGEAIWDGINSFLQRNSPGFISKEVLAEFGTDIPNAIVSGVNTVYTAASQYGQVMTQAMQSQMSNMSMSPSMDMGNTDMALAQYRADSQLANAITTDTTSQTTAAFVGMDATMGATFSNLGTTVATSLNGIKTNNNQAMTSVTDTTNKQLSNMRSSTQKVTTQMTNAWWSMKDNIVSAADQLQSQSSQRFNSLSSTIGNFYGKLQNPSRWGGPSNVHHAGNRSRLGRASAKMSSILNGGSSRGVRVAGGPSSRRGPVTGMMKIKDIIKQVCPDGNCFNLKGLDLNATVDVATFLQELVPNGGFGWYDWNSKHYEHIRRVSNEWDMEGPAIHAAGTNIATGTAFQVKEFENSTPKISFSSFQKMAEALFSVIPYDYYYNSEKYGSWQAALQAGTCNCYDGASALLALASTCGFSGTMGHGTWNGIPHVFAIINGKKMDTTGWQNRRNWNGVSAGGPSKSSSDSFGNTEKNVNLTINIDLSNAVVTDEKEFAEKVGDVAVKKIIDLTGVNPSTGR